MTESRGEYSHQGKRVGIDSLTFTATQLVLVVVFISSILVGSGWVLFTTGAFGPDIELSKQASISQYSYEQAIQDLRSAENDKQNLQLELSKSKFELASIKSGLDLKKAMLELEASKNKLISDVITSCVAASNAGQKSASDSVSNFYEGGGAAVSITAIAMPQDGSAVFEKYVKIYNDKLKIHFAKTIALY
jgi:hypothetical protein